VRNTQENTDLHKPKQLVSLGGFGDPHVIVVSKSKLTKVLFVDIPLLKLVVIFLES
jgi:hypothetical protein